MRLIDADKLNLWTALRPYCSSDVCCEITNIIDNAPTINPYEWISVEDRLPEELFTAVLIYCPDNDNIYCAYLNARNEWHIFDQGSGLWVLERVTHWMPLPSSPTEKEN
jgi:hypothetical protein